jgi:hypothetical protein
MRAHLDTAALMRIYVHACGCMHTPLRAMSARWADTATPLAPFHMQRHSTAHAAAPAHRWRARTRARTCVCVRARTRVCVCAHESAARRAPVLYGCVVVPPAARACARRRTHFPPTNGACGEPRSGRCRSSPPCDGGRQSLLSGRPNTSICVRRRPRAGRCAQARDDCGRVRARGTIAI